MSKNSLNEPRLPELQVEKPTVYRGAYNEEGTDATPQAGTRSLGKVVSFNRNRDDANIVAQPPYPRLSKPLSASFGLHGLEARPSRCYRYFLLSDPPRDYTRSPVQPIWSGAG